VDEKFRLLKVSEKPKVMLSIEKESKEGDNMCETPEDKESTVIVGVNDISEINAYRVFFEVVGSRNVGIYANFEILKRAAGLVSSMGK